MGKHRKTFVELPSQLTKLIEAGCDEVGRGCIAGPVVAAAVILDPKKTILGLQDSKKIPQKKRELLSEEIKDKALAWHVCFISPSEIDEINILNASFKAMSICLFSLPIKPEMALIDGNRFTAESPCSFECVIKGDSKFGNIAAASILAKTARDSYMTKLHEQFPYYNWKKNKGYPTKEHQQAVSLHGGTEHHRKSFNWISRQVALPLEV